MLSVVAALVHAGIADGQPHIVIVDRGPGPSAGILAEVLARPFRLVEPDTAQFVLSRDERVSGNLVVLGRRSTSIDGHVDGDLVVVGGDLFVHPGAAIGGRAVAIGGAVYSSTLADSLNETLSFRDHTFAITRTSAGFELRYQSFYADASSPLTLPGLYGIRMPFYDRVNGLSVAVGPALAFAGDRATVNAVVTYRSDLGTFDPSADLALQLDRRLRTEVVIGRGTFSNDDWIRSDHVNSLFTLVMGGDTRNYYRADRASITLHSLWERATVTLEPFAGALAERSWAVGPSIVEESSPWSMVGRTDTVDGMRRPNPRVPDLDLITALAGTDLTWESGDVRATGRLLAERSLHLDPSIGNGAFTQLTLDLGVAFPTFGDQMYEVDVHHVTTPEGLPPPQRFVYIGGTGTLPLLDLLEQGGGELLYIDQLYLIPVPRIQLRAVGIPTLLLRHRLGSAGIGRLPALEQALGVGLIVALVRGEFVIDPATRKTRISVGLSFAR
jgi:hypothetical protein